MEGRRDPDWIAPLIAQTQVELSSVNSRRLAAIAGARVYCDMREAGEDFPEFCWSFTDGKVLRGDEIDIPIKTPLSDRASRELRLRGFTFVGPTILYA